LQSIIFVFVDALKLDMSKFSDFLAYRRQVVELAASATQTLTAGRIASVFTLNRRLRGTQTPAHAVIFRADLAG
jgi:hypothetical protein